jgi:glycosyltransferase involved in cell wall biosynthesis
MRRLPVLSIAYPLAPVGPDAAGGAEQILRLLDRALARNGHTSAVIAMEGSHLEGRLLATPRVGGLPLLVILRLPPEWYPPRIFQPERPGTWLHCVSRSQERSCPPGAALLPYIENGVPIAEFGSHIPRPTYALALGRICPEKGFHLALDAPVIAFRSGALLHIVEHGRTSFLVNDPHEMARAIREVDAIDPLRCREAARERFSADRMTEQYLNCYQRLAEAGAQTMEAYADRAS